MWRQIEAGELNLKEHNIDLEAGDFEDCENLKKFMATRAEAKRKVAEAKRKELERLEAQKQAEALKAAEEARLAAEAAQAEIRCSKLRV